MKLTYVASEYLVNIQVLNVHIKLFFI